MSICDIIPSINDEVFGGFMKYPKFIEQYDTIGFVAPAFGCSWEPYKSCFENALAKFEAKGYKTELGPNCYKSDGVGISTNPKDCGKELTECYSKDTNQALISCGGGELMCETISYVDFDVIKNATPKWYMGYSDNTNFTFLLTTMCDTASIYGPNAPKFGMEPWHESIEDALKLLEGKKLSMSNYDMWELESLKDEEHPLLPYNLTEKTDITAYTNGINADAVKFSGRLIGGCMDCLVNLTGTKFDQVSLFLEKYKEDGFVWFLESCDLNTFSMRRAMWQMYEAGWFKYCKGFLIGRPMHFDEPMFGLDRYGALLDTINKVGVPVVFDLDIGHLAPSMPLVCGSVANISYEHGKINIDMALI